eukprot:1601024-Alexandrium_andersonii.AAC.1
MLFRVRGCELLVARGQHCQRNVCNVAAPTAARGQARPDIPTTAMGTPGFGGSDLDLRLPRRFPLGDGGYRASTGAGGA